MTSFSTSAGPRSEFSSLSPSLGSHAGHLDTTPSSRILTLRGVEGAAWDVGRESSYRVEALPGNDGAVCEFIAVERSAEFTCRTDPPTFASDETAALAGDPDRRETAVGAHLPGEHPRTPAPRITIEERILGSNRIRELADVLVRARLGGTLRAEGCPAIKVRASALLLDEDAVQWEIGGDVTSLPDAPYMLEVSADFSIYYMPVTVAEVRGGFLITRIPSEVRRMRRRWWRRVLAPAGYTIELRRAGTVQPLLEGRLRDVSFAGLSFVADVAPAEIERLSDFNITIRHAGDALLTVNGEVRFIPGSGSRGNVYGLAISSRSSAAWAIWEEFVNRILFPTTATGASFCDATWKLYERAGYFSLSGKAPDHFDALRDDFNDFTHRIQEAPHLGCHVVWPSPNGVDVQAAISMLKVYSSTWFGYQMAKITGSTPDGIPGRRVLRDIHIRLYEHVQRDPRLRWLVGHSQVKRVWSRIVHHDLPKRYEPAGMACVIRFRAVEVCGAELSVVRTASVDHASATETELLLRHIAERRPYAYCDALDLMPERYDLGEISDVWRTAGLARERVVLVARVAGRPVAAAIVERAQSGSHLFRLNDVVRMFALRPGGEAHYMSLLDGARDWFKKHDVGMFCWFIEEGHEQTLPQLAGLSDMGLADMTVLSAELLPEFFEHLGEVTAPRP